MLFNGNMELKPMQRTLITAAIWTASSLLSSSLSGSEEATITDVGDLPEYVVVATRTPLSLERVSPSVSYISEEEIELWQDDSLYESLSRESGVTYTASGAEGALGSLFVRGTNSDHTALFLDGRRLNPGQSNQYGIDSISTNNLSSIQLQKGASSVNYGSSGIGGVVDLQTRSALDEGEDSVTLTGEIGSNNYRQGSISGVFSGNDTWGISLAGAELNTDNERDHDEYTRKSGSARFDYKLSDVFSAELLAYGVKTTKEEPGSVSYSTPDNENETESWLLSPGIRYQTDLLSAHLFYSRSEFDYDGESSYGSYNRWVKSNEVNLQVDYSVNDDLLISSGLVYREDEAFNSYNTVLKPDFEQTGVYLQALWRVSDALELRGGLRYDDFSDYDNKTTGSLEVIYTFNPDTAIFAKAATSYAPPTMADIIFDSDDSTAINPEESVSYELGIRHILADKKLKLTATLFRNEIDELIEWVADYPYAWTGDTYNVSEALTQGIELSSEYAYSEKLSAYLTYTYLHAYDEDSNERLVKRPRHTAQFGFNYQVSAAFSYGINATGYFDRVGYSGAYLGDFVVVNAVVSWDISDDITVFARTENLFDKEYELAAGYPSLGRAGYIGIRLGF
jgi:vitamin B12 transporter